MRRPVLFLVLATAALIAAPADARKRRAQRPASPPAAAPVRPSDWEGDGARLLIPLSEPEAGSRYLPPAIGDSFDEGQADGIQVKLRVNKVKMKVPVTLR